MFSLLQHLQSYEDKSIQLMKQLDSSALKAFDATKFIEIDFLRPYIFKTRCKPLVIQTDIIIIILTQGSRNSCIM